MRVSPHESPPTGPFLFRPVPMCWYRTNGQYGGENLLSLTTRLPVLLLLLLPKNASPVQQSSKVQECLRDDADQGETRLHLVSHFVYHYALQNP